MKKQTLFVSLVIALMIVCLTPGTDSSAAGKKPVFAKKFSQISVGKTVRFSVKNVKKSYYIRYKSSNKRIASIKKNTGKCTGKNSGKCKIYATIYNKKNKKIKTLKQTLKVVKDSLLPNASFHLVQSINPFDYTVKIGCDRILLKKEVQQSKVTLIKNGTSSSLTASFSELSVNGKEVTYTMSSQSQKKLCPRNGTMNGTYTLSSPLFRKKISLSYQERIGNYSLSGYVLSVEGAPINQAYVKCMSNQSVQACYTDSNGYYHLEQVKNPDFLTVTKSGYLSETLTTLTTSSHATRCENVFLHREKENQFSAQIHVTEESGTAIPHASVTLYQTDREDGIICSGETDEQGNILFHTEDFPSASPCTKWNIGKQDTMTYDSSFTYDATNDKVISPLSIEKRYTLLIGKYPQENAPGYSFRKFTFCPKDYLTRQFSFDVSLSDSKALSLQSLSLKWDSTEEQTCSRLCLSFYQKGSVKPVLQADLEEEYFSVKNHTLSFTDGIPYSLPDGSYYIRAVLEDSDRNCITQSAISEITIAEGNCSSKELSCLPHSYARIISYGDFAQTDTTASFHRYEKVDDQFFYLDTLTSSPFQGREWDIKTADLMLPYTQAGKTYLLIPVQGELTAESSLTYTAEDQDIITYEKPIFSEEDIELIPSPLAKISCVQTSEQSISMLPSEPEAQEILPLIASDTIAEKSFVRECTAYPNSITVFYKMDGTFLSASLTMSPSHNIGTGKNNAIMDIYTNGKTLFTTQDSYQSS